MRSAGRAISAADRGARRSSGAVASLYDISCLASSPLFPHIQDIAFALDAAGPAAAQVLAAVLGATCLKLGDHFFVTSPSGTGISPRFDFTKSLHDSNEFVLAARAGGAPAPDTKEDVDWLELSNVQGALAKFVFRVQTKGGQPATSVRSACMQGRIADAVRSALDRKLRRCRTRRSTVSRSIHRAPRCLMSFQGSTRDARARVACSRQASRKSPSFHCDPCVMQSSQGSPRRRGFVLRQKPWRRRRTSRRPKGMLRGAKNPSPSCKPPSERAEPAGENHRRARDCELRVWQVGPPARRCQQTA